MLNKTLGFLFILFFMANPDIYAYNILSKQQAEFIMNFLTLDVEKENILYKKVLKSIFPNIFTATSENINLFFQDIENILYKVFKKCQKLENFGKPNNNYNGFWKKLDNNIFMHGFGLYSWPNGEKHIGLFCKDKQHSLGLYTWPTGGKFLGFWENNYMSGLGIYIRKDGVICYGYWQNDRQKDIIKIIPERVCYDKNKSWTTEKFFLEYNKNKIIFNKEIRQHLGIKLKEMQSKSIFVDANIICKQ